ncbi:MAG TPA: hypothetical protein ENK14_02150, partial [Caldithrix sp.]|nr:hypothetical protein [Caldithrix sp.]
SYNTTYLVVLKYEFKTNTTTDDEVSLFIFSSGVPSSESVTPDIGPLGSGENDQNINAISLRQYSSSQNITIDGIRFGPSWQLDAPLPIELSSFTASIIKQHVKLRWTTESEIDNVGFEIVRSFEKEGNYQTIATYLNNPELKGQGNSSTRTTYSFIDVTVAPGNTYWYKLVDVDNNGNRTFHGPVSVTLKKGVHPISETFPDNFKLYANYPNPFNPSTTLRFDIPKLSSGVNHATLTIYNSLGEVVSVLHQGTIAPGSYEVIWDGTDSAGNLLPSGIYYARLQADFFLQTIKMVMLK